MKAWCIWCEPPLRTPKNGYLWIHEKCFQHYLEMARHLSNYIEKHPDALPEEIIDLYERLREVDIKMDNVVRLLREAYE